jgi:hypothetical protein
MKIQHSSFPALLAVAVLAGCAPDGQTHPSESYATAEVAIQEVVVEGGDFFFEAPATIDAGLTRFRLANVGAEFHHLQLVKLEDGRTAEELLERIGAGELSPPWASYVGGPNSPMPGGHTEAVLDLEPGEYAMLCIIPSPDGVPHVMKGMVRMLTVAPTGRAAAAEPAADVRMILDDYSYDFETAIEPGRRTIRVENAAEQPHEVVFVRVAPGKALADVMAFFHDESSPPPFELVGGTTLLAQGQSNLITADFAPGEYLLLCMVPDAADGQPHIVHGMVRQITIR